MTATCTQCRARRLPDEVWSRNGKGWLCGSCSPNGHLDGELTKSKVKVKVKVKFKGLLPYVPLQLHLH